MGSPSRRLQEPLGWYLRTSWGRLRAAEQRYPARSTATRSGSAALKAPGELFHRQPGSSPVRAASRLSASLRRAAARAWTRPAPAREAPPTRKRWELCGQAKTPTPPGDRCSPCANRPLRLRRRGIVSGTASHRGTEPSGGRAGERAGRLDRDAVPAHGTGIRAWGGRAAPLFALPGLPPGSASRSIRDWV